MRRVLMTGDTIGGVWTFTMELASQLAHAGIDVCLAAFGGLASASQKMEAATIPGLTLLDRNLRLEWMDDPWDDLEESRRWLIDIAAAFQPDVIHLNTYGAGALSWDVPTVLTAHSCVASWWSAVRKEPLPQTWTRYHRQVGQALQAADVVVTPSLAMLGTLRANYSASLPHARVVPNGCTASRFRPAAKQPFILSAGRLWDEAKNVHAIAQLASTLPWPVYLAGNANAPGGGQPDLPGCHLLGQLPQPTLATWYARASIYVLPARYEPFGLSALEAALSGCALVLGDIPSLREIWGETATFVPPDDSAALQRVLLELIHDPVTRGNMAAAAQSRAQSFRASRMAAEYRIAYYGAARRRRACAA